MTWLLAITGLLLIALGFWLAPRSKEKAEPDFSAEPSKEEAWTILGQPLHRAEEIARAGEQENRRFQQGMLVGLGIGLLIAGGVNLTRPAAVPAPGVAEKPATKAPTTPATGAQPPAATAPTPQTPPAQTPPTQTPPTQTPPTQTPPTQTPPTQTPPAQTPPAPANVTFTIEPGTLAPEIAASLQAVGLITDPDAFLARVAELGLDTSLRAGTFVIPTGAGLDEVITALTT